MDECQELYISHTLREGNKVIDFFSNLGCEGIIISTLQPNSFIEKYKELQTLIKTNIDKCQC